MFYCRPKCRFRNRSKHLQTLVLYSTVIFVYVWKCLQLEFVTHTLKEETIQKNVKTRFLFNKLKTTTLYRPTLHNSIPKFWRQQFRARSGFNIAGSGRAGPIMPNSKSGRVGPGRNYIGPGWAGPKKLGPCRPLVHKFVQHIGCVHKQNLPRAISSGARPFINYL